MKRPRHSRAATPSFPHGLPPKCFIGRRESSGFNRRGEIRNPMESQPAKVSLRTRPELCPTGSRHSPPHASRTGMDSRLRGNDRRGSRGNDGSAYPGVPGDRGPLRGNDGREPRGNDDQRPGFVKKRWIRRAAARRVASACRARRGTPIAPRFFRHGTGRCRWPSSSLGDLTPSPKRNPPPERKAAESGRLLRASIDILPSPRRLT